MENFGILNVYKPTGMHFAGPWSTTSSDLVRPAKAGHAGTLDPLASGVLVICVGQATRLIQYVQQMPKTYQATFLLGKRSDNRRHRRPRLEDVPNAIGADAADFETALSQFVGEICAAAADPFCGENRRSPRVRSCPPRNHSRTATAHRDDLPPRAVEVLVPRAFARHRMRQRHVRPLAWPRSGRSARHRRRDVGTRTHSHRRIPG